MELEGSLPCSQHSTTVPYPYPVKSVSHDRATSILILTVVHFLLSHGNFVFNENIVSHVSCFVHFTAYHPACFDHPNSNWWVVLVTKLLSITVSSSYCYFSVFVKIFPTALCSQTPSVCVFMGWENKLACSVKCKVKYISEVYIFR
jgi:hypothetical protein